MAATGWSPDDTRFMRLALRLARRARGFTSPNPLVGAVLVKRGRILGRGWHHRAGEPHAEIEALREAARRGHSVRGATLYVTLEPCSTHGRTPPCTEAILAAGIRRVVAAATDPNPRHAGRGFDLLRQAGLHVETGLLEAEATRLNEPFNHWIVRRTPFVTVKAAMTLDGKIATAAGQSKWITGEAARALALRLRRDADAILVGVNTVLADDPALTARLVNDEFAALTTLFVTRAAPARRVAALARRVHVVVAPARAGRPDLRWILHRLGREAVTHLLVEGGGEVNAAFFEAGLVQRVAFFYAPKVLGGRAARKAVAGSGFASWSQIPRLHGLEWRRVGEDLFLTARVAAA